MVSKYVSSTQYQKEIRAYVFFLMKYYVIYLLILYIDFLN